MCLYVLAVTNIYNCTLLLIPNINTDCYYYEMYLLCCIEYRFDVKVVAMRNLTLDEGMYLGEADCFIQYHFPTQQSQGQSGM